MPREAQERIRRPQIVLAARQGQFAWFGFRDWCQNLCRRIDGLTTGGTVRVVTCGGVVGVCTACFLTRRGIDVVVDRPEMAAAASGFLVRDWGKLLCCQGRMSDEGPCRDTRPAFIDSGGRPRVPDVLVGRRLHTGVP